MRVRNKTECCRCKRTMWSTDSGVCSECARVKMRSTKTGGFFRWLAGAQSDQLPSDKVTCWSEWTARDVMKEVKAMKYVALTAAGLLVIAVVAYYALVATLKDGFR